MSLCCSSLIRVLCSLALPCYRGHCYCVVSVVMDLFDQWVIASVHWRIFAVPLWSVRPCKGRWGGSAQLASRPLCSRSKELAPASMPSSSRGSSTTQTGSTEIQSNVIFVWVTIPPSHGFIVAYSIVPKAGDSLKRLWLFMYYNNESYFLLEKALTVVFSMLMN